MGSEIYNTYRKLVPKGELIQGWNHSIGRIEKLLKSAFGAAVCRDILQQDQGESLDQEQNRLVQSKIPSPHTSGSDNSNISTRPAKI